MATVTSRVPALIDYLVGVFAASPLIGAATPPVTVYDGPVVTELDPNLVLYVGLSDPDATGGDLAAESVQEWGGIGRLGRNEVVTIQMCAQAWSGDDNVRTARLAAYGILAAVESALQADATQFGGNVLFPMPGATNEKLTQNTTDRGAIARVAFELAFKSRIGGF